MPPPGPPVRAVCVPGRGVGVPGDNLADLKLLRNAFRDVRKAHFFTIRAVVVLPEHLHCLWELPTGDSD